MLFVIFLGGGVYAYYSCYCPPKLGAMDQTGSKVLTRHGVSEGVQRFFPKPKFDEKQKSKLQTPTDEPPTTLGEQPGGPDVLPH